MLGEGSVVQFGVKLVDSGCARLPVASTERRDLTRRPQVRVLPEPQPTALFFNTIFWQL
jgi:hypothetical protein